jgi:signal transduction histidine kinase
MGFSELLLEDESLTGQTREYLTVISEESRRLSAMLNHYLSVLLVESDANAE